MTEKLEYRVCPECGEVYTKKKVKKILFGAIDVDLCCSNNHNWTEHFSMTYCGFTYNEIHYDRFGCQIEEESDAGVKDEQRAEENV